jgi:hypothetical protein
MEVYADIADGKAIAVSKNENNDFNIIIIFNIIEKDVPFEVYKKNGIWDWQLHYYETAPENIQNLMNEAEKIVSSGRQKSIFEMPKNVEAFLKDFNID